MIIYAFEGAYLHGGEGYITAKGVEICGEKGEMKLEVDVSLHFFLFFVFLPGLAHDKCELRMLT